MKPAVRFFWLPVLAAVLPAWFCPSLRAQQKADQLGSQAQGILKKYCAQCHGEDKPQKGVKVLDHNLLLTRENKKKRKLVVPGKPDDSELLRRMLDANDPMPPEGEERPTEQEIQVVKAWVTAGAPTFTASTTPEVKPIENASTKTANVSQEVKAIFRKSCQECHGGRKTYADLNILDFAALLKDGQLIAGKPEESPIFQRITSKGGDVMPKKPNPPLRPEEIALVRQWILTGASAGVTPPDLAKPAPNAAAEAVLREAADVRYVLEKVLADVRQQRRLGENVRSLRYFSLAHLLTRGSTRQELDLYRDALTVAINHLSWQRDLVKPRVVDSPTGTIFCVDLSKLGWDKRPFEAVNGGKGVGNARFNLFDLVLLEYPYGVMYQGRTFEDLAGEYLVPSGMVRPIPYVRADWFVTAATRPPLYHDLMQLPAKLPELEELLRVDSEANRRNFRVLRAGMTLSGVSRNNRVVERHTLPRGQLSNGASYPEDGFFWLSFDFRSSKGTENMFRDPVNLHPAGGEMIFSLPNGLQGYYVADGKGNRVDSAPTEIVVDANASDKIVVNGLGCIRCHDRGMKPFSDVVAPAVKLLPDQPGFDPRQVLAMYRGDVLNKRRDLDGQRFLQAMKGLLGKLPTASPLTKVSQDFLDEPLKLMDASAELGLAEYKGLEAVFRLPQFSSLGLAALGAEGKAAATVGNIRRDMWEDYFDQVVRLKGLGTPVVPLDSQVKADFTPTPAPFQVEFRTNKKNNSFEVGDKLALFVKNTSERNLHVELVCTSISGKKILMMPPTLLKAGKELRFPSGNEFIEIRGQLGKEHITLFASDQKFTQGQLLRGKDVTDRIIHTFYELRRGNNGRLEPAFDPATMVKKTLDIETK